MTTSELNNSATGPAIAMHWVKLRENQALTTVIGYTGSLSSCVGVGQMVAKKVWISS